MKEGIEWKLERKKKVCLRTSLRARRGSGTRRLPSRGVGKTRRPCCVPLEVLMRYKVMLNEGFPWGDPIVIVIQLVVG